MISPEAGASILWRDATRARDVAQAMGIPWEQLLAVAGIIPGTGAGSTRTQADYDLTPREAGLIDAFRALSEDHQSIVFAQVTGMAEATVRTDT